MANEISYDFTSGETLYACRFQTDGNVFVTDGSSDEAWIAADTYDVTMTENGAGGHFVGSFDASTNIAAGVYKVTVYWQEGANPANGDLRLGRGVIHWDGTAEIDMSTMETKIDDEVIGADGDTLEDLSDQIGIVSKKVTLTTNIYKTKE